MKKPWSVTTTLRNPERLRDFLIVLKNIDGEAWNLETQKKYQILLIKYRKYGYGSRQFYNGLSPKQINLINDLNKEISFREAEDIFNTIEQINIGDLKRIYENVGVRYQKKSQFEKADEMFNRASELGRNYYMPTTQQNYQKLYKIVSERGIKIIVMQQTGTLILCLYLMITLFLRARIIVLLTFLRQWAN